MKALVNILLALIMSIAAFCAQAQTITSFNTHVNQSGSEVVTDFLLTLPDGSQEVISARFGDDIFQVAGSETIPSVWNLPLETSSMNPGGGGPPYYDPQSLDGPSSGEAIEGHIERLKDDRSSSRGVPGTDYVNVLIYVGGLAVSAGTCVSGWYATRRLLISSCRDEGKGWNSITIGKCGMLGQSSIDCEEEGDEENQNVLSWTEFSNRHLPLLYSVDNQIFQLKIPDNDGF